MQEACAGMLRSRMLLMQSHVGVMIFVERSSSRSCTVQQTGMPDVGAERNLPIEPATPRQFSSSGFFLLMILINPWPSTGTGFTLRAFESEVVTDLESEIWPEREVNALPSQPGHSLPQCVVCAIFYFYTATCGPKGHAAACRCLEAMAVFT